MKLFRYHATAFNEQFNNQGNDEENNKASRFIHQIDICGKTKQSCNHIQNEKLSE